MIFLFSIVFNLHIIAFFWQNEKGHSVISQGILGILNRCFPSLKNPFLFKKSTHQIAFFCTNFPLLMVAHKKNSTQSECCPLHSKKL
ncbi:hypothetical protein HMPREF9087_0683 [Enterococcus casseliflavus ATCC 12755]|uniref:Uncharacterized protein n=1 Tax=Enterococcus casseliflavus ATCC 12755 TaxID=888066 RepID=F0EGZ1_ENTCA|nr:hypothetical protein HMPREF9087_0683 [Enterococcus casseliflavus ATCC 12755]